MTSALSPSNVVQVTVLGTPQGLAVPNINTVALISQEEPVWFGTSQTYGLYNNPTSVAQDFGSNSKAFAIANAFFSQSPNPIGTNGYLVIIPRLQSVGVAASLQLQSINYQAVATGTGGNAITIAYTTGATAGSEVVTVVSNAISVQIASGLSTAAQIVAAIVASTPASALVTASIFGSTTTPQTGPVSATNLASGSASGLEPVHTAMIRTASAVYYAGVIVDFIPTAPFTILPAYIQGLGLIGFFASNNTSDMGPSGLVGQFATNSQPNCRGLYYNDGTANDTFAFAAAYASRGMSTDFTGSLTAATMNLKQISGFAPDTTLTQTLLATAQANGVDVYPAFGYQGLSAQAYLYTSGANLFFDQVYSRLWLKLALQVAGFNYLAQASFKIPQTETGMDGLKGAYRTVLAQAVRNGYAAAGAWTSPTVFGNPVTLAASVAAAGYYVYSQPIALQANANKLLRQAPLVQIALQEAGAIHSSSVIVEVNP